MLFDDKIKIMIKEVGREYEFRFHERSQLDDGFRFTELSKRIDALYATMEVLTKLKDAL